MNRADVIRLALDAGFTEKDAVGAQYFECWAGGLAKFAALVEAEVRKEIEADRQQAIEAAVMVERESCARLADEYSTWGGSNFAKWFKRLVVDIRARTQPAPTGAQKEDHHAG